VTSDPFARNLATQYDFEVIADLENAGETAAIAMATQVCVNRAVQTTLVIPADIPLIHSSELEQILTHAPEAGSVLVPAADGRGSNAILRRPADLFPLRFGNDSFKPHLAAARATGKTCEVLHLSGIALDVDNPEDLRELLSRPGATLTQSLLGRWVAEGRLTIPLQDCD
jgi:2-phospho-L-lactate guanylyltransferase